MGRSVGVASHSSAVAYMDVSYVGYRQFDDDANEIPEGQQEFCEAQAECDWTHFKEALCERLDEAYKSLETSVDGLGWYDNEGLILAENELCQVVLYEYCGLVSLCLVPKDDDGYVPNTQGLAEAWCGRVAKGFEQRFSEFNKVGTFSNGESVYEKVV